VSFDISAHLRKSWEILRRYAPDPANFFRLASSALEPSDFEIVDSELTRLLELTEISAEVAEAMADVRLATGYGELKQASDRLRKVLSSQGILGLAAEPVELGFLQVYPQVEGVQRHPRGFAVR